MVLWTFKRQSQSVNRFAKEGSPRTMWWILLIVWPETVNVLPLHLSLRLLLDSETFRSSDGPSRSVPVCPFPYPSGSPRIPERRDFHSSSSDFFLVYSVPYSSWRYVRGEGCGSWVRRRFPSLDSFSLLVGQMIFLSFWMNILQK